MPQPMSRTARFVDASAPEGRKDIVIIRLSDGTTIRSTAGTVATLMMLPPGQRFVTYDVDAAGNRHNARAAAGIPTGDTITATLTIDDVVPDHETAERDAASYMLNGLFVRTWREVSALRSCGHYHVQALAASLGHPSNRPRAVGPTHICASCTRPCFCAEYDPLTHACGTCGRDDCPAMTGEGKRT